MRWLLLLLIKRNGEWVFSGPAVPAVGLRRLDVAVDVEVGGGLGHRRHGHVLVRLPQEASELLLLRHILIWCQIIHYVATHK